MFSKTIRPPLPLGRLLLVMRRSETNQAVTHVHRESCTLAISFIKPGENMLPAPSNIDFLDGAKMSE